MREFRWFHVRVNEGEYKPFYLPYRCCDYGRFYYAVHFTIAVPALIVWAIYSALRSAYFDCVRMIRIWESGQPKGGHDGR